MTPRAMFETDLRHHCRNPRCRLKLKGPVENRRSAFCCRGCYRQFYAKRCLVCEEPLERTTPNKLLCGRRACARDFNGLKAHGIVGRYYPHKADERNPITTGTISRLQTDQGWRVVAGSLTPAELRLAIVGAEHATRNNRGKREQYREAGTEALINGHHPPVDVAGGFEFPNAPAVSLTTTVASVDGSSPDDGGVGMTFKSTAFAAPAGKDSSLGVSAENLDSGARRPEILPNPLLGSGPKRENSALLPASPFAFPQPTQPSGARRAPSLAHERAGQLEFDFQHASFSPSRA
jgi:hypothetical protein